MCSYGFGGRGFGGSSDSGGGLWLWDGGLLWLVVAVVGGDMLWVFFFKSAVGCGPCDCYNGGGGGGGGYGCS